MCGCIAPALMFIMATIVAFTNKSANDDQTKGSSRTTKWRRAREDRFKKEQEQEQEPVEEVDASLRRRPGRPSSGDGDDGMCIFTKLQF